MSRTTFAIALNAGAACAALCLPAYAQEMNVWDMQGVAAFPAAGQSKTRAEVVAELADARAAGWQINGGEPSWFPELGLVLTLTQRSEQRLAGRVESALLATVRTPQPERAARTAAEPTRVSLPISTPASATPPLDTAAAAPSLPAPWSGLEPLAPTPQLPSAPEPVLRTSELLPLRVRDDRLDFRFNENTLPEPAPTAYLPAIEPPEAPTLAAPTHEASLTADQS